MLQAPENNIIVKVKHKYISNISQLLRLSSLENASTVDSIDVVNIVGEVVSIPKRICDRGYYEGYATKDIRVGDTAIFSQRVIYDLIPTEDGKEPEYKNRVWYEAKEHFLVDVMKLFGLIRGEEIIMVNGFVMIEAFPENRIFVSAGLSKRSKGVVKSKIMHIGNARENATCIEAQMNDVIYFNPSKAHKYQINGKKFCIIEQHHVLGIGV